MRVLELRDEGVGLEAFVVIDHDLFPVSAGGTRMLVDVDLDEVTRLARAMTWKHAAFHLPYAGAKAGIRSAGGDRETLLSAYKRALGRTGRSSSRVPIWEPRRPTSWKTRTIILFLSGR